MSIDATFRTYVPTENVEEVLSSFAELLRQPGAAEQLLTTIELPSGATVSIPGEDSGLGQLSPNNRDVTIWHRADDVTSVPQDTYDTERLGAADWYRIDVTLDIRTDTRFTELSLSSNFSDSAMLLSLPEVFSRLADAATVAEAAFSTIECESPPDLIEDGRGQLLSISFREFSDDDGTVRIDDWVDAVVTWQTGDRDDGFDADRDFAEHTVGDKDGSPVKATSGDIRFLVKARYLLWLEAVRAGIPPDQTPDLMLSRDKTLPPRFRELFEKLVTERVEVKYQANHELRDSPDETRQTAEHDVAGVLRNDVAVPPDSKTLPAVLPDSTKFELQPTCTADATFVTKASILHDKTWSTAQGLHQSGQRVAALFELVVGLVEPTRLLTFCAETDERACLQSSLTSAREEACRLLRPAFRAGLLEAAEDEDWFRVYDYIWPLKVLSTRWTEEDSQWQHQHSEAIERLRRLVGSGKLSPREVAIKRQSNVLDSRRSFLSDYERAEQKLQQRPLQQSEPERSDPVSSRMRFLDQDELQDISQFTIVQPYLTLYSTTSPWIFTPDSRNIVAYDSLANELVLLDLEQGDVKKRYDVRRNEGALAVSPDGQLIADSCTSPHVVVRSREEPEHACPLLVKDQSPPISFTADSQFLVTAANHRDGWHGAFIGQRSDWTEVARISGHRGEIINAVCSPTDALLATQSDLGTTRLWSIPDGRLLATLSRHCDGPRSRNVMPMAFSPDGTLLATSTLSGDVNLWNVPDGEWRSRFTGHSKHGLSLCWTRDSQRLIVVWDDGIHVWNTDRPEFEFGAAISEKVYDSTGKSIACGDLKDIAPSVPRIGRLQFATISSDGTKVAAVAKTTRSTCLIGVWDVSDSVRLTMLIPEEKIIDIRFSPDGRLLGLVTCDDEIKLCHIP